MSESIHQLISGRGFDSFLPGLQSRFRANRLAFSFHYSAGSPDPSLYIRLEGEQRLGDVCLWESGHCDLNVATVAEGTIRSQHFAEQSAPEFHKHLAALFRFVVGR